MILAEAWIDETGEGKPRASGDDPATMNMIMGARG